jgi:Mrp family chromosome partitioning ATPase
MNTLVATTHRLLFRLQSERGTTELVGIPGHLLDQGLMIARKTASPPDTDYQDVAAKMLRDHVPPSSRIFVSSPGKGEGKTCTAFNLACVLAKSGKPVLLVELNFSQPRFGAALGNLRIRQGLEGALHGRVEPADTVFCELSTGLHIAAARNATPRDKLQPVLNHLNAFLDWGSDHYEIVVVDCPSVISREWKDWFSGFVGPTLLVVRQGHTPLVQVRQAARLLNTHLQGVLLNGVGQNATRRASTTQLGAIGGSLHCGAWEEEPVAARSELRGKIGKTLSTA